MKDTKQDRKNPGAALGSWPQVVSVAPLDGQRRVRPGEAGFVLPPDSGGQRDVLSWLLCGSPPGPTLVFV